jgi:hypothetical protein
MSQSLPLSGILRLDHVALPYPAEDRDARIRAFWEPLGMKVTERVVEAAIDHAGAGIRYDVGGVGHAWIVYYPSATPQDHVGHVAFAVDPHGFARLIEHPGRDTQWGKNGIIKWGNRDASLFLHDPYGARIEFRCVSHGP